jgi:hypothetical protein
MDSLATTITSLAAELTLEFIDGACLHKFVELACWLAQFCGAYLQAQIYRACLLAPSLGHVFAHLENPIHTQIAQLLLLFLLQSF